jgi:hypothetical protein
MTGGIEGKGNTSVTEGKVWKVRASKANNDKW